MAAGRVVVSRRAATLAYAASAAVAVVAVAAAGFVVGHAVRGVLDDVVKVAPGPGVVVTLDQGEQRSLLVRLDAGSLPDTSCVVTPLDGASVTLDDLSAPGTTLVLGHDRWWVDKRIHAVSAGSVQVSCPGTSTWALGPDLVDGRLTSSVTSPLRWALVTAGLGLLSGATLALLVALRRRQPSVS